MNDPAVFHNLIIGVAAPVVQEGGTQALCLGISIAVVCSWQRNKSILWAIFHGILSWFYVIYFALTRDKNE